MSKRLDKTIQTLALTATIAASCALPTGSARAGTTDSLDPYRGPGTWIDLYDPRARVDPLGAVDEAATAGVRTLYVETANYHLPRYGTIAYPFSTASLIDAAHARGMKVVAWYLPSFAHPRRDLKRSLAAIRFRTPLGGQFDSFALDIEANVVRSVARRNRRALTLSRRIRRVVGPQYALGAIVPDKRSTTIGLPSLWPYFPYTRLSHVYDVFLPMSYSSSRGRGASYVNKYTLANVTWLRVATRNPELPVHVIGGLANRLGRREAAAVIDAARVGGAIGASFYKLSLSGDEEWLALGAFSEGESVAPASRQP
jgi:hypothetical protein